MVDMDSDLRPSPVPRPRVFPVVGTAPGPRCGHTLTAISGPEGDLSKAKLVLFGKNVFGLQSINGSHCFGENWTLPPPGGATALEGSSGKSEGAQSTPGSAASGSGNVCHGCPFLRETDGALAVRAFIVGIRLAGATNDVHIFDVRTGKWEKTTPAGEPPSPRAAHAAAAVGNMVVIQVGKGFVCMHRTITNIADASEAFLFVIQGGIGPAGLASEDLHVLDFTDPDRPRWHR